MYKVSVKRQDVITHQASFSTEEEAHAWIASCESQELWGPTAKEAVYELQSILIEPEVQEEIDEETGEILVEFKPARYEEQEVEVTPAIECPYTVEIKDLSQDYDYLLSECHAKRRAEYPPMEMYLDAAVKSDEEQMAEYVRLCLAVKAKYPLPGEES